jgi:hypothetical protein
VFGDEPDVVDEVREERGDDAAIARLDLRRVGTWTATP